MLSTVQKIFKTRSKKVKQGYRNFAKKVSLFYKKNKYPCLGMLLGGVLLLSSLLFLVTSKVQPNDDIYFLGTTNKAILENKNPTFNVAFGQRDEPEKQWIRFEAQAVKENPFEEESKENIFIQLLDFVRPKRTFGIELSLEKVGEKKARTSTELIETKEVRKDGDTYTPFDKLAVLNPDVVEGVDIEYQIIEGMGLKEDIIIKDLNLYTEDCDDISDCDLSLNEFVFDLKLDSGLELRGAWYTYKGKSTETYYFTDSRGNYVAHFLPSWAVDSNGVKTYDVDIKIIEDHDTGGLKIIVVVDKDWLFSEERVYPVRIDPTIVHDTSLEFEEGSFVNTEVRTGAELGLKEITGHTIDTNTVGYWKLDEESGSGAYLLDSSGNNNHGTPTGTTYISDGKIDGARSFNGTSDIVSVPDSSELNPSIITLEAWILPTIYQLGNFINKGYNVGYRIRVNATGTITFFDRGSTNNLTSNTVIPLNQWSHVVATGDSSGLKIYINGTLDAYNTTSYGGPSTTSSLLFGEFTSEYYAGLIDEVRISDIARTPEEIKRSYLNGLEKHSGYYTSPTIELTSDSNIESISWNSEATNTGDAETPYSSTGLIAHWKFNETSGTTAVSGGSCGTSCNGTLTSFADTTGQDTTPRSGWTNIHRRWGSGALRFDGVDDFVNIGNDSSLSPSQLTMSVWVKITGNGSHTDGNHILAKGREGAMPYASYSIQHREITNEYEMRIGFTDNTRVALSTQVTDSDWTYLVGTYDGQSAKFYMNGELKAYEEVSKTIKYNLATDDDLYIGKWGYGSYTRNINGVIDNVQIYNRALSPSEILSNYQAGNIEFQYRTSDNGTTWNAWQGGTESVVNSMNSDMHNWNTDGQDISRLPISIQDTNPTRPTAPTGCLNSKPVVINNLGNKNSVSDYQIKLNVDHTSGMANDFSDLRFTNSSGQNLPYWIESYTSATNATIWFKLDTIGSNSSGYVYMWYNSCTGGLASDGEAVFEFFDDFETADTTKFTYGETFNGMSPLFYNITNGVLRLNSDSTWRMLRMKKDFAPADQVVVGTRFQKGGANSWSQNKFVETADTARNRFGLQDHTAGATRVQYRRTSDSTWQLSETLSNLSLNTWYKSEVFKQSSNTFEARLFTDAGVKEGLTFSHTSSEWNNITWTWLTWLYENVYVYYDWLYIRNYIAKEPLVYIADSNNAPYITDNSSLKIDTTGSIVDSETVGYWKLDEDTNITTIIPSDSNLVGYWDLEEESGAGAYLLDKSGNNNHATPSGTTHMVGRIEQGRHFNGSSESITIPHHSSLSFERTDSYSLEAWFRTASTANQRIINKMIHTSPYRGYDLSIINGVIRVNICNTSVSNTIQVDGTTNVTDRQWYHVVVTYDGSSSANGVNIYLNGKLENKVIIIDNLTATTVTTDNVMLGIRSPGNDTSWFSGRMDEVGIYNRELSASEIKDRFESTQNIIDYSGNNSHGYSWGTTYERGRVGGARSFSGTSDSVSIPSNLGVGIRNVTIEAWVNLPSTSTRGTFVNVGGSSNGYGIGVGGTSFDNDGNNLIMLFDAVRWIASSHQLGTGWRHVVMILNASSKPSAYVDGVLVYSDTSTNPTSPSNLIGIGHAGGDGGRFLTGALDEVKIHRRILSQEEIYESYRMGKDYYINKTLGTSVDLTQTTTMPFWIASDTLGSNLELMYGESKHVNYQSDTNTVGLWRMDEERGSGAYIKDSSSNNFHGTPSGTTYINGKTGGARLFNGTSDTISMGNVLAFERTDSFTLEAWVRTTSTATGAFIAKMNNAAPYRGYNVLLSGGTTYLQIIGTWSTSTIAVQGTTPINTGYWTHVAVTYDGSSNATGVKIYVNGVQDQTTTIHNNLTTTIVTTDVLRIGSRTGGTFFPGHIDEVRISDIVRNPQDIRQTFERERRSHPITVDFKADLLSSNLITNSSDLSFNIDETTYGSTEVIENIDRGEKIIVKENYNGIEYIAQGEINTINKTTGAVTVSSWDTGSTFPSGGFTVNATVFKWQREYVDTRYLLSEDKDTISQLTFRKTTNEPATFWIDDMRRAKYSTDSTGANFTMIQGAEAIQYKPIFSTWDENISSDFYLTSVSIDYNSAPLAPSLLLTEGETNPAPINTLLPKFSALFNDDNITDTSEEYYIQVNTQSDFAGTTMWDSGWQIMTSTGVGARTPDITYNGNPLDKGTTYYWRIKFKDNYDAEGAWSVESAYFTTNAIPSAPTGLLTEGKTNPTAIKVTNPQFSAIYNDPDVDDTSSYYEIHVNTSSNFTGTVMWGSGKTAMTTTIQGDRSPNITYGGDPLNMNDVTYYWRIKFWDNLDNEGEWSLTANFTTANDPPTAPTSLLTESSINPPKVTTITPSFSAIFGDPNGGDTGEYYEIHVNTSSGFTGTSMWESGKTAMTSTPRSQRSPNLTYGGTTLSLNGVTYYWRIKFWDNHDAEGAWSATAQFTMSGPPLAPTELKVDNRTSPPDILSTKPKLSALYQDPNDDNGIYYQIQVNTNSSFTGTTMWDSNKQSMGATPSGAHSPNIEYNGTTLTGTSSITYYWRIRFWDVDDQVSQWSNTGTFVDLVTQQSLRFGGVGMEGVKLD